MDSGKQVRETILRHQTMLERERTRLARQIHDEFGAALAALKLDLHWIIARLSHNQQLQQKAAAMSQLIDQTLESLNRTESRLRPRVLDDFGLVAAVEWQVRDFERQTGIRCNLQVTDQLKLQPSLATAVFRIIQEALMNVMLHANATEVFISLRAEDHAILLEVRDNGAGINDEKISSNKSLGLDAMRDYAGAFAGEIHFEGRPGRGTTVRARIPL